MQNDCAVPLGTRTLPHGPHSAVLAGRIDKPMRGAGGTLQHPLPRRDGPPVTWDPTRTLILRPTEAKWTTTMISSYNFGEAVRGLFPMGGENDEQFRLENIVRLSTGTFKI